MTPKKIAAGIAAAGILASGGTVATDRVIDPYTTEGTSLTKTELSVLPEAGTAKAIMDTKKPKMTLEKWDGEVAMGVTYDGMKVMGARPFLSKNVEWKDGDQTMQVVPLEKSAQFEDGGYEINIVLDAPPTSNVFNFSIDGADTLDFFYQPALTDAEIKKGASRPENVVGSYAVYYKDHANHIEGQINYGTGKAYHIYRPKVTDAAGHEIWAEMSYAAGVLSITVPQSFLDAAKYPVIVDPTFGLTTQGASNGSNQSADRAIVSRATLIESGDITKLTAYVQATNGGTKNPKALIFDDDGAAAIPGTLKRSGTATALSSASYIALDLSLTTVSLTAGDWYLGFVPDALGIQMAYDSNASFNTSATISYSYASPPASWTGNDDYSLGRRSSVYATYTSLTAASAADTDTYFEVIDD